MTHNPFPDEPSQADDHTSRRQAWLGALARASLADVEAIVARLATAPSYKVLRPAESGAIMLRGRAGGGGRQFNLGEASVTRCAVRLDDGQAGLSYALGRDRRKAELAAVLDALLQQEGAGAALFAGEIQPLIEAQAQTRLLASRKAAATKVDFFTMVRGEG